ncbi:MAG: hypothetical protein HYV09_36390 [Deltaproteobacteria bacterium]|nr:hypothetical protein [Deltaproteobacteria bacterium]
MSRLRLLLVLATTTAFGCATAEDTAFVPIGTDSGSPDTSAKFDTGEPDEDTGLADDTGKPPKDSGISTEDTGAVDSFVADTGAADSAVADTASADTSVADTSAADTFVADTFVADGSADTFAADTSVDDTYVADTYVEDTASADTSADADAGSGPTRLYPGAVTLQGVTTDDWAIVADGTSSVIAIPLSGGASQTVATSASRLLISGKVVFVWSGIDSYGFGTLRAWTATGGAKIVATKSLAPSTTNAGARQVAAASTDGAWIAFTDGGTSGIWSRYADFKVASADGTAVKTVFTQYIVFDGIYDYEDWCAPKLGWVGTRFVTTHCPGSGTVSLSASSLDPAAGTATTLGTNLGTYWTTNETGTIVSLLTNYSSISGGTLRVVAPTGGAATTIDTGVAAWALTRDGSAIVYQTMVNALKRSPTASPAPTTLVTSGVVTLLSAPSDDDKFILYSSRTAAPYDVRLASATTAGTGTVLHATANAAIYGDAFSADSKHALYFASVVSPDVGTFTAHPVAGGSVISLGSSAWIAFATSGGKLVWNDDHVGTTTSGRATIRTRDMSSLTGTVTTIASGADRAFALSTAKDRVVYTLSGSSLTNGLWVAPIP